MTNSTGDRRKRVRPYPLHELPRLLLVQVELAQVFRRHLAPVLEAAEAATAAGWARLQQVFGGRLALRAHDPYLFPGADLEARVQGAALLRLERLFSGAGQPAILALDPGLLDAHQAVREEELLADEISLALTGAPVRCAGPCTPDQALELLTGGESGHLCMALDLGIETAAGRFWGRLLCPAALRLGIPAAPQPIGASFWRLWQRRGLLQDAPAELILEAGYGLLPAAQIAALEVGDVILLDRFGPRPVVGGPVWLRLGDGHFPAHLGGAGVTLTSAFQFRSRSAEGAAVHRGMSTTMPTTIKEEQPANEDEAAGPPGDAARVLRELPVQIVCEIGRVTLTGAEVLELRPGTVLPVGRPLAGPVDLTVGGRVIARGELVDVEGEIGVRVVEVPG